jgi:hypothetical protein
MGSKCCLPSISRMSIVVGPSWSATSYAMRPPAPLLCIRSAAFSSKTTSISGYRRLMCSATQSRIMRCVFHRQSHPALWRWVRLLIDVEVTTELQSGHITGTVSCSPCTFARYHSRRHKSSDGCRPAAATTLSTRVWPSADAYSAWPLHQHAAVCVSLKCRSRHSGGSYLQMAHTRGSLVSLHSFS